MKVLLDECVTHLLRAHLVGHDVYTVSYMGWAGKKNGLLLNLAATNGFEVLVTTDQNLEYQQNLTSLPLPVVVMEALTNELIDLLPLVPQLLTVLMSLPPHGITHVR